MFVKRVFPFNQFVLFMLFVKFRKPPKSIGLKVAYALTMAKAIKARWEYVYPEKAIPQTDTLFCQTGRHPNPGRGRIANF